MTSDQLFKTAPKLTAKQQTVLDLTQNNGQTDLQIGYELHTQRGCRHCLNSRHGYCDFAASDARQVLRALRRKGLVVRRKSGLWQHVGEPVAPAPGYDPSRSEIPF